MGDPSNGSEPVPDAPAGAGAHLSEPSTVDPPDRFDQVQRCPNRCYLDGRCTCQYAYIAEEWRWIGPGKTAPGVLTGVYTPETLEP